MLDNLKLSAENENVENKFTFDEILLNVLLNNAWQCDEIYMLSPFLEYLLWSKSWPMLKVHDYFGANDGKLPENGFRLVWKIRLENLTE